MFLDLNIKNTKQNKTKQKAAFYECRGVKTDKKK